MFLIPTLIVRIPLIIVDPRRSADTTRGTVNRHLVESIDLVPTFVEVMSGTPSNRLDGRSLSFHFLATLAWREIRALLPMLFDHLGKLGACFKRLLQKPVLVIDARPMNGNFQAHTFII